MLFRSGGNSSPNSSNPWGNWQDWRLETQKDWEQSLKSRNPWIKTTRNSHKREIDPKANWGYFLGKFSDFWGKEFRGGIPWQPKAADTNMLRVAARGGPMFKDSQGYEGDSR